MIKLLLFGNYDYYGIFMFVGFKVTTWPDILGMLNSEN